MQAGIYTGQARVDVVSDMQRNFADTIHDLCTNNIHCTGLHLRLFTSFC